MGWLGLEVALNNLHSPELNNEMGVPTQFGRPDWPKEFASHVKGLKEKHKVDALTVGVFACGNKMLVKTLVKSCSATTDSKTKLKLFAEEF